MHKMSHLIMSCDESQICQIQDLAPAEAEAEDADERIHLLSMTMQNTVLMITTTGKNKSGHFLSS